MPSRLRTLCASLSLGVVAAGCVAGAEPDPDPLDRAFTDATHDDSALAPRRPGPTPPATTAQLPGPGTRVAANVTVSGKVGYNDLRSYGRWSTRRTLADGTMAQQCPHATCDENYLGLYDARVLIREQDLVAGPGCSVAEVVAATKVRADGTYTWTGDVLDTCLEPGDTTALVITVELQYCDDVRCVSVEDPGEDGDNATSTVWTMDDPSATLLAPLPVATDTVRVLPAFRFEEPALAGASPADVTDLRSQAANVFASLIDATRRAHLQEDIPFRQDVWGALVVKFPTLNSGTASGGAQVINIPAPGNGGDGSRTPTHWFDGNVLFHEYGHTVYFRAFDPGVVGGGRGYGFDGNDGWSIHEKEWPEAAMGEGWANFFTRAMLDNVTSTTTERRCHGSWDPNSAGQLPYCAGVCSDGHWYPESVTKALCDWYDLDDDDDPNRAGLGDRHDATLLTLWQNLRDWSTTPGSSTGDGLDLCEYADWVINVKLGGSAPARARLLDLLQNNAFDCGGLR